MANYNKFYFAKLNINGNIWSSGKDFDTIKNELIPEFLLSFEEANCTTHFFEKDNKWSFKDIIRLGKIIKGNLTKEFYEEKTLVNGAKTNTVNENIAGTAEFYYFIDSEIIAFRASQRIPYKSFINYFQHVFNDSNNSNIKIGEIVVELLTQKDEIKNQLINNNIKELKFSYVAPNDKSTNTGIVNSIITDTQASKFETTLKNTNGLVLNEKNDKSKLSTFINGLLYFVSQSWGSMTAITTEDKTISSENYPVTKNIESNDIKNNLQKEVNYIDKQRKNNENNN